MAKEMHYGSHHHGDSAYEHKGAEVKLNVLGVAVLLTLTFSFVELVGGLWANSLALIGDAGHMATDSLSLLFALVANWISRKGVDNDHSFGHGRVEVLAAFLNGLLMLGVVAWIIWEAIGRFQEPPTVAGGSVLIVATIGLVINLLVAWRLSADQKNLNTRAALLHVIGDLLGSVAAITAGALIYWGGERFAIVDPILSVFVALLVLKSTISLLKASTEVLLDAVPAHVKFSEVGDALASIPGVRQVHDLHVWTLAPEHAAVMAHLSMEPGADWSSILQKARDMIQERFGIDHVTLQPEWLSPGDQCAKCTSGQCGWSVNSAQAHTEESNKLAQTNS